MVYIAPGTFNMGSPSNESDRDSDEVLHEVRITKGFYIGVTEITQGQWKKIMGNNPSNFSSCGDDCPVEQVSWLDCQEFIKKLNEKERSDKYRLPTEAEWEYAARAGTSTPYAGASLDAMGWYGDNSGSKTHPVAKKQANAWGLYDMHGNVWEWCFDVKTDYSQNPPSNPIYTGKGWYDLYTLDISGLYADTGSSRVIRGGYWSSSAQSCRSAYRHYYSPSYRGSNLGARLARIP
ncbi:MAG: formylglycine-generating enzyme family protein [Desulfobacterales bacterium]|nr:formylglycine-generating enzyme family protein [Desulfobacterales bacterium]